MDVLNVPNQIETYPYFTLVLGIFFGVGIFALALAWNNSIVSTIELIGNVSDDQNDDRRGYKVIFSWIYTIVLTIVILVALYIFRAQVPVAFLS